MRPETRTAASRNRLGGRPNPYVYWTPPCFNFAAFPWLPLAAPPRPSALPWRSPDAGLPLSRTTNATATCRGSVVEPRCSGSAPSPCRWGWSAERKIGRRLRRSGLNVAIATASFARRRTLKSELEFTPFCRDNGAWPMTDICVTEITGHVEEGLKMSVIMRRSIGHRAGRC
jgi:hypothetical protein